MRVLEIAVGRHTHQARLALAGDFVMHKKPYADDLLFGHYTAERQGST